MRVRALVVAAVFAALPAFAEKAAVNIHLDPSAGTGLDRGIFVSGASLKVDTTLIKALGPVAPQIELFGMSAVDRTYLYEGAAFGVGLGVRLRLFNDEKGYYFNPGTNHRGNFWGNFWADVHLTMTDGELGPGFDVATGYEFSVVNGLSVGPFAKLWVWTSNHEVLQFGLSFTIGAPQTTPAEADWDGDGVLGDDDKCPEEAGPASSNGCPVNDDDRDGILNDKDKCPTEPEDKDNYKDDDGCPEPDNDGDGVLDGPDRCPIVAGPKENAGCPDGDKDGDGLVDRLDKCPEQAGPKENEGCPDTDKDGDTVVDRLDKCLEEKGDPKNDGCPWPDTDKDTVVDPFDNCPTEAGPPDNQGCPKQVKQLVVITSEKLVIKEQVYFDFNKATIQPRSFPLLDQVMKILTNHPEIKLMQIEGHTDNVGDAAYNRTLSQQRADSVKAYLVKKGIAADRLRAMGFGPDKPQDSNETKTGRDNNRRVEFNIVDQ